MNALSCRAYLSFFGILVQSNFFKRLFLHHPVMKLWQQYEWCVVYQLLAKMVKIKQKSGIPRITLPVSRLAPPPFDAPRCVFFVTSKLSQSPAFPGFPRCELARICGSKKNLQ